MTILHQMVFYIAQFKWVIRLSINKLCASHNSNDVLGGIFGVCLCSLVFFEWMFCLRKKCYDGMIRACYEVFSVAYGDMSWLMKKVWEIYIHVVSCEPLSLSLSLSLSCITHWTYLSISRWGGEQVQLNRRVS